MNNLKITGRIEDKKIMQKRLIDERQIYHLVGFSVPHHNSCYNPATPVGIKNKTRRVETIIDDMICKSDKTRRVDKIIERMKTKHITPLGLLENLAPDFYNQNIPLGLKTNIHQWIYN